MMRRTWPLALVILLVAVGPVCAQEAPRWGYVEAGYIDFSPDEGDSDNGVFGGVSFGIFKMFHVVAEYDDVGDFSFWNAGGGWHGLLGEQADLFEEIKMGALLQRGVHHDPALVSGVDTLTMATSGGARALGGGLSGRVAEGEAADLILVDTGGPTGTPMTSPVAFLSYAAHGTEVTDVFVAGRRLLADRVLTTLDEEAIRADAAERVARIRAELAPESSR